MSFNRSEFMKTLHKKAKARREFFNARFPDKDVPKYGEFLAKDNPVDKNIIAYEVSFQLSYQSQGNGLKMKNPETFTIYAYEGAETSSSIYERTKSMVLDMKGKQTGDTMPMNTRNYFDNNDDYLNINVSPRGLEKVEETTLKPSQYRKLTDDNFVLEKLDGELKITNKKDYESRMKLDITHFM